MSDSSKPSLDPEVLELIREFVVESRDVVSESEPALVQLEDPDADVDSIGESVSAVFRMFHSMKGSAGLLGLKRVEKITHAAESLLAGIRDARIVPDPQDVDALCQGLDCINHLLACIEETHADHGWDELVERTHARLVKAMSEFEARAQGASTTPANEGASSDGQESLESTEASPEALASFREDALALVEPIEQFILSGDFAKASNEQFAGILKSLKTIRHRAGDLKLRSIELLCHSMKGMLKANLKSNDGLRGEAVKAIANALVGLRQAIEAADQNAPVEAIDPYLKSLSPYAPKPQVPANVPTRPLGELLVEQGSLCEDELDFVLSLQHKRLGELVVDLNLADAHEVEAALEQQRNKTPASTPKKNSSTKKEGSSGKNGGSGTIRVDLHKLDALLDQVGELITAAETVAQRPELRNEGAEQLLHSVWHLTRITSGLHDTAMSMRMVPVRPTFRKVLRVVRDVSKKVGKKIEVKLSGEDTEIDKTVVEAIADPLMHIIRNAVDHGVETPEKRLAAGKPETGTIHLSSRHEGGDVFINVQDDGAGIDPQKLIARAKERGLVPQDTETMPKSEAYELLFRPGFSTASQVTDISGRGVGMDVVRRNVESVRGRVQISSEIGKGSTFSIRIPLTLAIIDGMLVRVGANLYAIPLLSIRESVRVDNDARIKLPEGGEMVKLRGEVFPIMRLHEYHQVPNAETRLERGILVMVENEGRTRCLFVDEILGQRQIVVKGLDNHLLQVRGVSGCSITGTGEICLILDVHELLMESQDAHERPELSAQPMEYAA